MFLLWWISAGLEFVHYLTATRKAADVPLEPATAVDLSGLINWNLGLSYKLCRSGLPVNTPLCPSWFLNWPQVWLAYMIALIANTVLWLCKRQCSSFMGISEGAIVCAGSFLIYSSYGWRQCGSTAQSFRACIVPQINYLEHVHSSLTSASIWRIYWIHWLALWCCVPIHMMYRHRYRFLETLIRVWTWLFFCVNGTFSSSVTSVITAEYQPGISEAVLGFVCFYQPSKPQFWWQSRQIPDVPCSRTPQSSWWHLNIS